MCSNRRVAQDATSRQRPHAEATQVQYRYRYRGAFKPCDTTESAVHEDGWRCLIARARRRIYATRDLPASTCAEGKGNVASGAVGSLLVVPESQPCRVIPNRAANARGRVPLSGGVTAACSAVMMEVGSAAESPSSLYHRVEGGRDQCGLLPPW